MKSPWHLEFAVDVRSAASTTIYVEAIPMAGSFSFAVAASKSTLELSHVHMCTVTCQPHGLVHARLLTCAVPGPAVALLMCG